MANFHCTLLHITVTIADTQHPFTFVTQDITAIQSQLDTQMGMSVLPMTYTITYQKDIDVGARKDRYLCHILNDAFKKQAFLRWNGTLPWSSTIHEKSVRTDLLMQESAYFPSTEFENFLDKHGVLSKYYHGEVVFHLKHETEEYSRSFGHRSRIQETTTSRIDDESIIHGLKYTTQSDVHTTHHTVTITKMV